MSAFCPGSVCGCACSICSFTSLWRTAGNFPFCFVVSVRASNTRTLSCRIQLFCYIQAGRLAQQHGMMQQVLDTINTQEGGQLEHTRTYIWNAPKLPCHFPVVCIHEPRTHTDVRSARRPSPCFTPHHHLPTFHHAPCGSSSSSPQPPSCSTCGSTGPPRIPLPLICSTTKMATMKNPHEAIASRDVKTHSKGLVPVLNKKHATLRAPCTTYLTASTTRGIVLS